MSTKELSFNSIFLQISTRQKTWQTLTPQPPLSPKHWPFCGANGGGNECYAGRVFSHSGTCMSATVRRLRVPHRLSCFTFFLPSCMGRFPFSPFWRYNVAMWISVPAFLLSMARTKLLLVTTIRSGFADSGLS